MNKSCIFRITLCCLAVASPGQAQSQLEGTLFTGPEERELLDYLREEFVRNSANAGFNIEEAIPEIPEQEPVQTAPVEHSFGGIMTRRDGQRSIWLDGTLRAEADLPAGFTIVEVDGVLSLRVARAGGAVILKPGQTLDMGTGVVVENFVRNQTNVDAGQNGSAEATPANPMLSQPTQLATQQAPASAPAPAAVSTPDADIETTADALVSVLSELDEAEVDALAEAMERRMQERLAAEEGVDED